MIKKVFFSMKLDKLILLVKQGESENLEYYQLVWRQWQPDSWMEGTGGISCGYIFPNIRSWYPASHHGSRKASSIRTAPAGLKPCTTGVYKEIIKLKTSNK